MKTAVHENSIEAYYSLKLTRRQNEVVQALRILGQATDQEIADYLNYQINRVTGRLTELRDMGIVIEDHNTTGNYGKRVRVSRLKNFTETLFEGEIT